MYQALPLCLIGLPFGVMTAFRVDPSSPGSRLISLLAQHHIVHSVVIVKWVMHWKEYN